jgi:gliding motility-associated-like protein
VSSFKNFFVLLFAVFLFQYNASAQNCSSLGPSLIKSVSVEGNVIKINWDQNPSSYTDYYVLYVHNPSWSPPWDVVDTIFGAANTSIDLTQFSTSAGPHVFSLMAVDICGQKSFYSLATAHQTMLLKHELDICEETLTLSWNPYRNRFNGIFSYKIFASVDGAAPEEIGSAGRDTFFIHTSVPLNANICYTIQAVDGVGEGFAYTNTSCVFTAAPDKANAAYIKSASVSGNAVVLSILINTPSEVKKLIIERSTPLSAFEKVAEMAYSPTMGINVSFEDITDLNTSQVSYLYRLRTVNICEKEAGVSNTAKTILLTAENKNEARKNILNWTLYEGFDAGLGELNVYRSTEGTFSRIGTFTNGVFKLEDDLTELFSSKGEFCYYVEAIESTDNFYNIRGKALSNVVCLEQLPFVYIPTAFMPEGINSIFKPVFSYPDREYYSFEIFNRWGQKLFQTNNPEEGWNGEIIGGQAPAGVYVYLLRYRSTSGTQFERKGILTLIR